MVEELLNKIEELEKKVDALEEQVREHQHNNTESFTKIEQFQAQISYWLSGFSKHIGHVSTWAKNILKEDVLLTSEPSNDTLTKIDSNI